jgi:hypothetical protein
MSFLCSGSEEGTLKYEVVTIPGKGMGLRASKYICRGELVLREKPIVRGKDIFRNTLPGDSS